MKQKFSKNWKASKQPRKQRKYRANAPLHVKSRFLGSHLSRELRKKYKKRSAGIRKGDKVKVLRGKFKGKTGTVQSVDIKKARLVISGIEMTKKDGSKKLLPINPSNIQITELNLDDKLRVKALERK